MNRTAIIAKIEEIAERVAQPEGIEIVEVDLKGSGRHQVLRIVIDRPAATGANGATAGNGGNGATAGNGGNGATAGNGGNGATAGNDKPAGVTHGDCEFISLQVGTILDVEDLIHGTYNLEVSSPGVERKLVKWKDWERFVGEKAKVVLREPVAPIAPEASKELKYFEGVISRAADHSVTVELPDGARVTFPVDRVERAHLSFEW